MVYTIDRYTKPHLMLIPHFVNREQRGSTISYSIHPEHDCLYVSATVEPHHD